MSRDLRHELEGFDGTYPTTLKIAPGEIFVGIVQRFETGPTAFGPQPIMVCADEKTGEECSIWLLHTVLRNEIAKQKPLAGERIGLKRLPDHETKGYARWVLRVDRDGADGLSSGAPPDFSSFAPADDAANLSPASQTAPASCQPAQAAASNEELVDALRAAGGTTQAKVREILGQFAPVTDFTKPDGSLALSGLSPQQQASIASSLRSRFAGADDEIPF